MTDSYDAVANYRITFEVDGHFQTHMSEQEFLEMLDKLHSFLKKSAAPHILVQIKPDGFYASEGYPEVSEPND